MTANLCKSCGAPLTRVDAYTWECGYCHNTYTDKSVKEETERLLRLLLSEEKIERVSNLRRNLYDAVNAKYTDSEEIIRICGEIKALLPDDFTANFYYTANHGTPAEIKKALRDINAQENIGCIEEIVHHILRSMRADYALPLQNLVERAYKNTNVQRFEQLSTLISSEAERVSAGMYETAVPRDVFVAYSSRDMAKVEELVDYLEENGLDCFVAARNLRHGRGAVQNYERALCEAMDNCSCIVFVSSVNSRSTECDALKVELKYVKGKDILNSPPEYRQAYVSIPYIYKKKRIEYRIDNEPTPPRADRILKEFFWGLEYSLSPEAVLDRFDELDGEILEFPINQTPAEPPRETEHPAVKYCAVCGSENTAATKFCCECGKSEFVGTYKEYEQAKEIAALKAKMKADEERRAAEKKASVPTSGNDGRFVFVDNTTETDLSYFNFKLLPDGTYSAELKDANNCPEALVFPSYHNGRRVTAIAENALKGGILSANTAVKVITLPDSVVSIGECAFEYCTSLTSISIPSGVTSIGKNAFWSCKSLASISLPSSVTSIGETAFWGCDALKRIELPDSVTFIGGGAFAHCNLRDGISIPASVKKLEANPFRDIPISEINIAYGNAYYKNKDNCIIEVSTATLVAGDEASAIPNSVTSIGECAFIGKDLTNIILPRSVTSIGKGAFDNCKGSLTFDGTKEEWDKVKKEKCGLSSYAKVIFTKESATDSSCFEITATIGSDKCSIRLNKNKDYPENIVIPSEIYGKKVTEIGTAAFGWCNNIKTVVIPDGVTKIADNAFSNCSSLTGVTIPGSVTHIGDSAFEACRSLWRITLPEGVTYIGNKAFWSGGIVREVNIPSTVKTIIQNPFAGIKSVDHISVSENNPYYKKESGGIVETATGRLVFGTGEGALSSRVKAIGFQAYNACASKNIKLPAGLLSIDTYAFLGCRYLESITIPRSLKEIGYHSFCNCKELRSITFEGTKKEWKAIKKDSEWKEETGSFTVFCSDGKISKLFS